MARSGLGGFGADSDDESDYNDRKKRRKFNPAHTMNDVPPQTAPSSARPSAFAAKMMAKMGYKEGQGLGASGSGRLAPVDAQVRPQGVGLGSVKEKSKAAKEEEKRAAALRGQTIEDSSEEERKRKAQAKASRKAASGGTTPKPPPKQKYRTANEIEVAAGGLEIPNVLKSIIDATGQETRVLASTAGLLRAHDTMIPAETETTKLSRMAKRETVAFAEEWRALQERKEFYEAQQDRLYTSEEHSKSEAQLLGTLTDTVENLQVTSLNDALSWEVIISEIEKAARNADTTDEFLDIQEVAVAVLHPIFKRTMQDWDPLEDASGCSMYLERIGDILRIHPTSNRTDVVRQDAEEPIALRYKSTTSYESLIYTLWLPVIRSAVNTWDVSFPDAMIKVVECWQPVLPSFILANVVDSLIEQRLAAAVSTWKPRRNREGPVSWLLPWFKYLDQQHINSKSSTGLLAVVKRKLKTSFSTWDISHGVFPSLDQWQSLFQADLSHMLVRYILPRLSEYFAAHFDVDPADQDMKSFEKILQWVPYFSLEAVAQLFTDIFFKKWHQILYLWLIGEPNHAEIMQWYQWWKQIIGSSLPAGFNELPIISASWDKGLTIINTALDAIERNGDVAAELQPLMFGDHVDEEAHDVKVESVKAAPKPVVATFKDVVEDWCAENGLLMFPMREADLATGLPLFRITASASGKGGVVLYLKGDVTWVRTISEGQKIFVPMGLGDDLAAKAEGR